MEAQGSFNLKCIKNFCSETVPHDFIYRAKTVFDNNNLLEHCRVVNVTLWDPQVLIKNLIIFCPARKVIVHPIRWKDGSKSYEGPRKFYGLKEDLLLISRVYRSDRGHQVLAHDPGILSQTHSFLIEPFLLLHKGGIIREFCEFIISHVDITFSQLGGIIRQLYEFIISHVDIGITPSDILALWHQTKYNDHVSLNLEYQK